MKPAKRERPIQKAWRDAHARVPSVPRDPEGAVAWVALLRLFAGVLPLDAFLLTVPDGAKVRVWAVLPILLATSTLVFCPARWLSWPLVRRGATREAFRLMRLLALDAERRAAAVSVAALALARHDEPSRTHAHELAWLEAELALAIPRGSRGIVAYALLRALRGDHESTRALFEMVAASAPKIFERATRRLASSWLVADYARRGEFGRIARLFRAPGLFSPRASAFAKLLAAVSARLVASPNAPSNRVIRLRHWLTPHRRATRPLVERALAAKVPAPASFPSFEQSATPLARALAAHKAWLVDASSGSEPLQRHCLTAAGRAWDELEDWLQTGPDSASGAPGREELEQMLGLATADLVASTTARDVPLGPLAGESSVLERAYDQVCEQLFETIEQRVAPLRERVQEKRGLPAIEEWLEWATLLQAVSRAHHLGGERVRRGAFAGLHSDVTSYAVWLYNERRQHLLAHTLFRWLLVEARWAQDEAAIRLCADNSRIYPE